MYNTYGVSSTSGGGAADVARRLDLSLGLLAAAGVLPRTGGSLTPWSGVCELPTEAGAEHFIRLPPSWRQGLHDAPPAGTLKSSSLGAATRNFNIAC